MHFDSIRKQFIEKIYATFQPVRRESGQLVSFSCAIAPLPLMDWLIAQNDPVKVYWASRDSEEVAAGVGFADLFDSSKMVCPDQVIERIEDNLSGTSDEIRYYGGMSFDPSRSLAAQPDDLRAYCFFVPRFEIRRKKNHCILQFNIIATLQDDAESIIVQFLESWKKLSFDIVSESGTPCKSALPAVVNRFDIPDRNTWQQQTLETINRIQAGHLKKVVQTRILCLELAIIPDALALLGCVSKHSIHTYDFCFQIYDHSFIGCSPECLYKKEERNIYSEALAGTNASSIDRELDMQFQGELLESDKEALEHEYVYENIKSELENICDKVIISGKREILPLGYVQHLRSKFKGILRKGIRNRDILNALHPTAAVNGYPKEAALSMIRRYEQFSRGWYAGPVGWISRDCSEFSVAIRSAHVTGKHIKLFAGAGIVGASDPLREWNETEIKMAPFLRLFETSLKS